MGQLLNDTLASAAQEAGIHFVPVVQAFEGHNVCDGAPWIRGFDLSWPPAQWFHPYVTGQAMYARLLEEYFVNNFPLDYTRGFFESGMPRNPLPVP